MSRVFIVGWDGATFDLIKPWVAEGKLPNIASIMEAGVHGSLRSTLPPMTFPAWTSFMTGKNPGKHAIFDFTRQRPGTYDLEFINGGQRKAPTFWKLLGDAGKKVISISVPCTYPPEKVNGIMLSGFDAPGVGGSDSMLDARGMHPPELCEELLREVGGHPMGSFPIAEINQGRLDVALEKIVEAIRRKAETTKYLITTKEWDCAMILFGESDGVGHDFWKYCDPESPLHSSEPSNMRDAILRVYQELDTQLGELRDLLPMDTTLLMMSDHGFGGVSDMALYPNCWLRDEGVLKFRGGLANWASRRLDALKMWAVAKLPSRVKRMIFQMVKNRIGGLEAQVRYGIIDWQGTQAYFEENPYYPVLRINVKGRQPSGTVEPGEEYEALRSRLIKQLEEWRHPETGEPVVLAAYRREDIYDGPYLDEAPDILVHWNEFQNYSYAFKVSSKSSGKAWTERVTPDKVSRSGSHRDFGIFLAEGGPIREGREIHGANIWDIAPTILHLLEVPVPADMDGSVLVEALDESMVSTEVAIGAAVGQCAAVADHVDYDAADDQAIADRLRALGYID
jgi:predicted AlkP superfamily phosphohydrolase/phosphomutase